MSLPPTFNMATTQQLDGKQSGAPGVCASTVAFADRCNVESARPRPSCCPTKSSNLKRSAQTCN